MKTDEARRLLSLPPVSDGIVTPQQVRVAFHRAVRRAHPDSGGDVAEASQLVEKLGEARKLLLERVDTQCPQCHGEGSVQTRARFGAYIVCMKCGGSGESS